MYEWGEPKYFLLLLALPLLSLGYLLLYRWKKRQQRAFADAALLKALLPEASFRKYALKALLMLLVVAALTLALVNLRMGLRQKTLERKGVDLVFLLDVSKSMLAEDAAPNRLLRAKQLINRILDQLVGDRVGILVYAGRSYNLLPLTTDYAAARFFLSGVNTDIVPSQGTAIAQALESAHAFLKRDVQKSRFVVILSDGEDHGKNAVDASQALAADGIQVYTLGVGSPTGGPIPLKDKEGRLVDYKRDRQGKTVITKMHPETLRALAAAGKGQYVQGNNSAEVVKYFKELLAKADKNKFESKTFSEYENQFQWFLALALLLLLFDSLVLPRKTRWIRRLNPFNEA